MTKTIMQYPQLKRKEIRAKLNRIKELNKAKKANLEELYIRPINDVLALIEATEKNLMTLEEFKLRVRDIEKYNQKTYNLWIEQSSPKEVKK